MNISHVFKKIQQVPELVISEYVYVLGPMLLAADLAWTVPTIVLSGSIAVTFYLSQHDATRLRATQDAVARSRTLLLEVDGVQSP